MLQVSTFFVHQLYAKILLKDIMFPLLNSFRIFTDYPKFPLFSSYWLFTGATNSCSQTPWELQIASPQILGHVRKAFCTVVRKLYEDSEVYSKGSNKTSSLNIK